MKIETRTHPHTGKILQVEVFPFLAEDEESRLTSASLTVDATDKYIRNNLAGGKMSIEQTKLLIAALEKACAILEDGLIIVVKGLIVSYDGGMTFNQIDED